MFISKHCETMICYYLRDIPGSRKNKTFYLAFDEKAHLIVFFYLYKHGVFAYEYLKSLSPFLTRMNSFYSALCVKLSSSLIFAHDKVVL